jgi:hypothetical protein
VSSLLGITPVAALLPLYCCHHTAAAVAAAAAALVWLCRAVTPLTVTRSRSASSGGQYSALRDGPRTGQRAGEGNLGTLWARGGGGGGPPGGNATSRPSLALLTVFINSQGGSSRRKKGLLLLLLLLPLPLLLLPASQHPTSRGGAAWAVTGRAALPSTNLLAASGTCHQPAQSSHQLHDICQ